MTSLDQIPMLRRPGGAAVRTPANRPRRAPAGALTPRSGVGRRRFLQGATVVGFAALTVFSAAREAYADGYDIWEGDCPSYATNHDCSHG